MEKSAKFYEIFIWFALKFANRQLDNFASAFIHAGHNNKKMILVRAVLSEYSQDGPTGSKDRYGVFLAEQIQRGFSAILLNLLVINTRAERSICDFSWDRTLRFSAELKPRQKLGRLRSITYLLVTGKHFWICLYQYIYGIVANL